MAKYSDRYIVDPVEINAGEIVCCDFCNGGEDTMGGCLIGSYGICGDCQKGLSHPEEIDEVFDPNKTFTENILEYRERVYGTRDCIITISERWWEV